VKAKFKGINQPDDAINNTLQKKKIKKKEEEGDELPL